MSNAVQLRIINDKKLTWGHVKKAMFRLTSDTLNYEAPLSISEIAKIHFVTGRLLDDYYGEDQK